MTLTPFGRRPLWPHGTTRPVAAAPPAGGPPSGYTHRFRASDLGLSDGAAVSSWSDTSGNGNTATAASGNEPTYKTAQANGKAIVRFDGTDDFLTVPGDGTLGKRTYALVLKSSKTTNNQGFSHGSFNIGAFHLNFQGTSRSMWYLGGANYRYFNDYDAKDDNAYHLFVAYLHGSTFTDINSSTLTVDGTDITVHSSSAGGQMTAWGDLQIARDGTYFGQYDLAEFLVWTTALDSTQRSELRSYCQTEYGTP